jgi:intein/homing endonuclease
MWDTIEQMYRDGVSLTKIVKQMRVDYPKSNAYPEKISKFLKSKGHKVINRQNQVSITDDFAKQLLDSGMSLAKIGQAYSLGPDTLAKRLKKIGYNIVNKQNERGIIHNIFNSIDSEEKAYWFGFISGDGCIISGNNSVEVTLQLADKDHLVKLKNFIKANNDFTYNTRTNSIRYSFSSKEIRADLITKGCTQKKSLTLKRPNCIPSDLIKHYIRGYFDADGCITFTKNTKNLYVPVLSIISTEDILLFIKEKTSIPTGKIRLANKKGSVLCKEVGFYGKSAIDFLELIYENSNIHLDRKYSRYKTLKENNYAVQDRNILNY